jgi:hypothetical protein
MVAQRPGRKLSSRFFSYHEGCIPAGSFLARLGVGWVEGIHFVNLFFLPYLTLQTSEYFTEFDDCRFMQKVSALRTLTKRKNAR